MSVPVSKRTTSKLDVFTKANELCTYTIHICSNEKYFPKKYRWCITAKIVDAAVDITRYASMANSVYVGKPGEKSPAIQEAMKIRLGYQTQALAQTSALLTLMEIAYRTFGIDGDRITHWTGLVLEVQNLLRAWHKSDKERAKGVEVTRKGD